jgi:hypothetical protein
MIKQLHISVTMTQNEWRGGGHLKSRQAEGVTSDALIYKQMEITAKW